MILAEFVPPRPHPLWKLCPQMGITDVVVKVNPELTGLSNPWRFETLKSIVSCLKSAGLDVIGLEGDPFDMSPIKEYGERGTVDGEREETIAHYRELLESMGRLGIKLLCYNFMVGKGWSRTGVREGRGGAKATYFALNQCGIGSATAMDNSAIPQSHNSTIPQSHNPLDALRAAHDALRAKLLPQIYSLGFLNPDVEYFK